MATFFATPRYRDLAARLSSLRHSPGNLHFNEAEIFNVSAQIEDERWEHDHPHALSCFRVEMRGVLSTDQRTRFETRAEAEQAIYDQLGRFPDSCVIREFPTRRGLERLTGEREAA